MKKTKKNRMQNSYTVLQSKKYINHPLVSVITPVFNNEKTIEKTLKSVMEQSLMPRMEYIVIDDGSKDNSRAILKKFVDEFPNIKVVFLNKNTGTPAYPRNMGIKLSTAPYLTFLDADDWLEKSGLEKLYTILKETNDDYVVGRTIKITSKKKVIVGEHESCKERRSIPPKSIPHIFNHLGPRARMIKSSIIKDHNIQFPEMKFAEDKQFFMEVLTKCNNISTTEETIYYLNRLDENNDSLTKQTNTLAKMNCNKQVINYFKQKELDEEIKKMVFNRLYEFDCFHGLVNRYYKLLPKYPTSMKEKIHGHLKRKAYIVAVKKALKTTSSLDYQITDYFHLPHNRIYYDLFKQKRYKELEAFAKWYNEEKIKKVVVKKDTVYWHSPLAEPYNLVKVPLFAELVNCDYEGGFFRIDIRVKGDHHSTVEKVLFRDRKNTINQVAFSILDYPLPLQRIHIPESFFSPLSKSIYNIYLVYNEYNKVPLQIINPKLRLKKQQTDNHHFYKTKHEQLALKII